MVVDRRFWVREGKRKEFEIGFWPGGIWARFLARSAAYIATDVKGESPDDGRYRVRDFGHGRRGFEGFRERYSEDFAQFDRQIVDGLIERQEFVGAYYEADGKT